MAKKVDKTAVETETRNTVALETASRLTAGGERGDVAITSLIGWEANPRTAQTWQVAAMVDAYRSVGYDQAYPIVVNLRRNGDIVVLRGNRRVRAAEYLHANDPETYARVFPSGEIPAVIHRGLSAAEEAAIALDHAEDRQAVPLDPYGEYLAVEILVRNGYDTQDGIAAKLGKYQFDKDGHKTPNRSWVQQRCNLARLPGYIREEFEDYWTNPNSTSGVRVGHIAKLYSTYRGELAQFPNGDGPLLRELFVTCAAGREESGLRPIKPADLAKRADFATSTHGKRMMLAIAGKTDKYSLADCDAAIAASERDSSLLLLIAAYLGADDYRQLVAAVTAAKEVVTA